MLRADDGPGFPSLHELVTFYQSDLVHHPPHHQSLTDAQGVVKAGGTVPYKLTKYVPATVVVAK